MVANLPPALSTRASNKNCHPGAPDLPKPRRSSAEVTATNAAEEEIRRTKAQDRQDAVDRAAAVEDRLLAEEEEGHLSEIVSDKVEESKHTSEFSHR